MFEGFFSDFDRIAEMLFYLALITSAAFGGYSLGEAGAIAGAGEETGTWKLKLMIFTFCWLVAFFNFAVVWGAASQGI
jgi:hypothetical protein